MSYSVWPSASETQNAMRLFNINGSNSICSLPMVENKGNITLNQTLMDFNPDSVIWIRQLQHKAENNPIATTNEYYGENATTNNNDAATTTESTANMMGNVTVATSLTCSLPFTSASTGC